MKVHTYLRCFFSQVITTDEKGTVLKITDDFLTFAIAFEVGIFDLFPDSVKLDGVEG